jgi:hypothetical protein
VTLAARTALVTASERGRVRVRIARSCRNRDTIAVFSTALL